MIQRNDPPHPLNAPVTEGEAFRLDRRRFSVTTLDGQDDDGAHWAGRPVSERLAALEHLRRMAYGNATATRLQRVLEVARLGAIDH